MLKIASISSWIIGLGFGLPCIYGIWHLLKKKEIASVMGFPAYGHGPFEKIGLQTTVLLLILFFLVCIAQCIVGQMLWSGDKRGAILSLILIPFEIFFYVGFALPYGPPFVIARTLLVIFAWSSLTRI